MQPAAGDVGDAVDHGFHFVVIEHVTDRAGVELRWLEQHIRDRATTALGFVIDPQSCVVEHNFSHQTKAVGMDACGGDP